MMEKHVSKERWQALYGPAPEAFHTFVQYTVKATREAKPVKRFTARTVILAALILILLMGITYAATRIFGTMDYLRTQGVGNTSTAALALQTNLAASVKDCPDITATVRDAVHDGMYAYVTVAYAPRHPKTDMLLYLSDANPETRSSSTCIKGFSRGPLTNPDTDPRRKLIISDEAVFVYGVYAEQMGKTVYEEDGTLVMVYAIPLNKDMLFVPDPGVSYNPHISWAPSAYEVQPWAPEEKPPAEQARLYVPATKEEQERLLSDAMANIESGAPLAIDIKTMLGVYDPLLQQEMTWLYYVNIGLQIDKTGSKAKTASAANIPYSNFLIEKLQFVLTDAGVYGFAVCAVPSPTNTAILSLNFMWPGSSPENLNTVQFEIFSDSSKPAWHDSLNAMGTKRIYASWWPRMKELPDTITLVQYSYGKDMETKIIPVSLTASGGTAPADEDAANKP